MRRDAESQQSIGRLVRWQFFTLALLLSACGGGSGGNVNLGDESPTAAALALADPDSPYADVMIDCVMITNSGDSCLLSELPLLAQETNAPTVDDILSRTIVSHDWMAERFREYLEAAPAEILPLFRPLTAVVISADIRPSQYSPYTGAIYLDAAFLWTTNAEKATISSEPDYRSGFGDDLSFVPLFRYVKNGDFAWEYYSLSGSEVRSIADLELQLTALLLHELAHANDFFPPDSIVNVDPDRSVWNTTQGIFSDRASSRLLAAQPLNSEVWYGLAAVLFGGEPATQAQLALSPDDVGLEFDNDSANDSYAYTSKYEDVAMLFEEVMMSYLYATERDVLFTDRPPPGQDKYCDDYIVSWGSRDRAADLGVGLRAELVLQILLGETDVSQYFQNLDSPQSLTPGVDLCSIENLDVAQPAGIKPRELLRPDTRRMYR